jgi:hypothetical protein
VGVGTEPGKALGDDNNQSKNCTKSSFEIVRLQSSTLASVSQAMYRRAEEQSEEFSDHHHQLYAYLKPRNNRNGPKARSNRQRPGTLSGVCA